MCATTNKQTSKQTNTAKELKKEILLRKRDSTNGFAVLWGKSSSNITKQTGKNINFNKL
jgi:hypothetical protein